MKERPTHLDYYRQHGIAPVNYDLSDMAAHLQRREALYNKLGLPPVAFRGSSVLEVAAGTGQNSLYLAHLQPAILVLLEPNATAVDKLRATYDAFTLPHVSPEIVTDTLEEFTPQRQFDIVLCENWLGTPEHELALLRKLGDSVAEGGVLVVTTVAPLGFVPNLLRRFLAGWLISPTMTFEEQTSLLVEAFTPHLATLGSMTRSVRDWVQDNMLNPAYFGLCLSIPKVVEQLRSNFDALGTTPSFEEDWRWFKSLAGASRRMNEHFLDEYWRKSHCFFDHRMPAQPSEIENNRQLEQLAYDILAAVEACEHAEDAATKTAASSVVLNLVRCLRDRIGDGASADALLEFMDVAKQAPSLSVEAVAGMKTFGSLFGRETVYLSLLKRSAWAEGAPH